MHRASSQKQRNLLDQLVVFDPTFSCWHRVEQILSSSHAGVPVLFFAVQKLFDYLHSHHPPWFKADVQAILDEPDIAAMREGIYVGMHIRRGDKKYEARATTTKERMRVGMPLSPTIALSSMARRGDDEADALVVKPNLPAGLNAKTFLANAATPSAGSTPPDKNAEKK